MEGGVIEMIGREIVKGLWCGDAEYWERNKGDFGYVIHGCKEPYHRRALGYKGRGAPKDDPEYLVAERGNELCLNLIDAPEEKYISEPVMLRAIYEIKNQIAAGVEVFVHCNEGRSRGPGICLGYLRHAGWYAGDSYSEAKKKYLEIYPEYKPGSGIEGYLEKRWDAM